MSQENFGGGVGGLKFRVWGGLIIQFELEGTWLTIRHGCSRKT